MISITNTQRVHTIDEKKLEHNARVMLSHLGYQDFDLGILLCGTTLMKKYNNTYRKKNKVTDVLSFPFHENAIPNTRIVVAHDDEKNLGDLIICPDYVARTCHKWERDFNTHLTALLAHGIAHLLGHDHIEDDEFEQMQAVEKKLIEACGK